MKRFSMLLLAPSLLSVACARKGSADNKLQGSILGRWWPTAGFQKITMEFTKDGTSKTTIGGQTTNGTYKWLNDSTIELNGKQQVKVTVSQDQLTMIIGNETSKFEREKKAASSPRGAGTPVEAQTYFSPEELRA